MPDLIGHLHFYPRKSHNCLAARHSPSLCLGIKKSESLSRFAQVEIRWRLCGYLLNFLFYVNIGPEKDIFLTSIKLLSILNATNGMKIICSSSTTSKTKIVTKIYRKMAIRFFHPKR